MNNGIFGILSLAAKSGKITSGEFSVKEAVLKEKAKLVIVSEDASDNTKKLFTDKASYRNIPVLTFGTKTDLGRAIGKEARSSIAVLDEGFKEIILKKSGDI